MGQCVAICRRCAGNSVNDNSLSSLGSGGQRNSRQTSALTKNKPLNKNLHSQSVKIEPDWSLDDLQKQRAMFWDTAPAYDGRAEIWQALKASAEAVLQSPPDYDHAQLVIDSAGISLPQGNLESCYDELGTLYSIPTWVVATPKRLKRASRSSLKNSRKNSSPKSSPKNSRKSSSAEDPADESNTPLKSPRSPSTLERTSSQQSQDHDATQNEAQEPIRAGSMSRLASKLASESGRYCKLTVRMMDHTEKPDIVLESVPLDFKISQTKLLLAETKLNAAEEGSRQLWLCAGRILKDTATVEQCKIPKDFLIQVHLK